MPNIAIYEGGKAARMNGVSVITTDDGNGGKVEWVPQSDRQTGTLHVSQNGTYRAEDEGLHSWSKVTVRLAGAPTGLEIPTLPDPVTGAEIPTGEIGLEEPVPPAGLEPIEDEPISTDEAERILEDAGLDPSDLDPDSPNYDDAMEAIGDALGTDPDNVKVVDPEKKEDVKKEQPKVEDKGQKATGTDPDTGEPATITPSGKKDAIEYDELRIITPPSRTSYKDGDTIEYSGISCALYKDGKFVRSATFEELSFPVETAQYDGTIPDVYTDGEGVNAIHLVTTENVMTHYFTDGRTVTIYVTAIIGSYGGNPAAYGGRQDGDFYLTRYQGDIYAKGKVAKSVYVYEGPHGPWKDDGWAIKVGSAGHDAAYFGKTSITDIGGIPESSTDPQIVGPSMWSVGQHQPVPVQCAGLSASFDILVTKSSLD